MANAICERVIGTIRRECFDWLIPLSESQLRSILKSWIRHYNIARPHMALEGPQWTYEIKLSRLGAELWTSALSQEKKRL